MLRVGVKGTALREPTPTVVATAPNLQCLGFRILFGFGFGFGFGLRVRVRVKVRVKVKVKVKVRVKG